MNDRDMAPEQEYEYYRKPANQVREGPAKRRKERMTRAEGDHEQD